MMYSGLMLNNIGKERRTTKFSISKATERFLLTLSKHCSNSPLLKNQEYTVTICSFDGKVSDSYPRCTREVDLKTVRMYPSIEVFPDNYHRKPANKMNVVSHVILDHFEDSVFDRIDEYGNVLIKEGSLVPGTYRYAYSWCSTGKNYKAGRRWTRIR